MSRPQVNDGTYITGCKQPNGKIVHIDWHDKEVLVECYDTREQYTYEWNAFDYYHPKYKQWMLERL
jgi:hypothetical protein